MSTEPLWRGPTEWEYEDRPDISCVSLDVAPGTEVEVWPAGDRTSPTREQIWHAISNRLNGRPVSNHEIDRATDGVLALLHGQGDETDGD